MRKILRNLACLSALLVIGSLGLAASPVSAAGNSGSAAGIVFPLGPFPGQPAANCPSTVTIDNFVLQFVSGNTNPSGATIEGDAYLVDTTLNQQVDFGHATLWGNATNFTATYHGGTIDFHVTANKPHGLQVAKMKCA